MVYGLGTLKLLASNAQLREELAQCEAISLLASVLEKCSEVSIGLGKNPSLNSLSLSLSSSLFLTLALTFLCKESLTPEQLASTRHVLVQVKFSILVLLQIRYS